MSSRPELRRLAAGAVAAFVATVPAAGAAASDQIDEGRTFVAENCAECHAIGADGASPRAEAPPFRTLHEKYPVDQLAEALAEGIVSGHPDMPEFVLEPDEIEAVIAYLRTLE